MNSDQHKPNMNVLLTSAGRRGYLVEYFKQALNGRGQVVCANAFPDSAAMYAADQRVVVPFSNDSAYVGTIIDLCHKYEIGLICSFHDLDVYVLSQHCDELRHTGAVPVLPSAEWGRLTLDKYESTCLLNRNGFSVPWTSVRLSEAVRAIEEGTLGFPVTVKARGGFGSIGLSTCYSIDQIKRASDAAISQAESLDKSWRIPFPVEESVLFQQTILGNEYCIGLVNDLRGRYASHLVTHIHAMRAGESDAATTVDPQMAGDFPLRLSCITGHCGIWGVDCMQDNGVLRIIDINPRFTGDYPFQHIAGANIPAALIAWACDEQPDPFWLQSNVGVRAYKNLVPTPVPVTADDARVRVQQR